MNLGRNWRWMHGELFRMRVVGGVPIAFNWSRPRIDCLRSFLRRLGQLTP